MQLGKCYQLLDQFLNQLPDQVESESARKELQNELANLWHTYLRQHPSFVLVEYAQKENYGGQEYLDNLSAFYEAVQNMGIEIASTFLNSISESNLQELDVPGFFKLWANACESGYDKLVRSDECAKAIGFFANSLMVSDLNTSS